MNRVILVNTFLAMVCLCHPLRAQFSGPGSPPPKTREENRAAFAPLVATKTKNADESRIAQLSHTKHLVCAPDGGLIGVALHLQNLSKTESINLRREADGNVPLSVDLLDQERKPVTARKTAPMPAEKGAGSGRTVTWTLGPGESRWFFLPLRSLFESLPAWDRLNGCHVIISVKGLEPSQELLAIARARIPSENVTERWMNLPGIDSPFASSFFNGVTITRNSLQANSDNAYAEARRKLEDTEKQAGEK